MSEKENDIVETSIEKEKVNIDLNNVSDDAKMNVLIGWGLLAGGFVTGILFFAGFIWAILKKDPKNTEFERTHYKAMTSMMIWSVILYIVSAITAVFLIGFVLMFAVFVWNIYRIVNGIIKATDRKPYPINK